jgi:DNA-binding transcriptional regulator YiaG
MSQVHPQARTTPWTRAEIKSASETLEVLAQRYTVSKATVRKWRNREDVQDRSHRPHKLSTTLTPG